MPTHTDERRFNSQPARCQEISICSSNRYAPPSPLFRTIQPSKSLPNIHEHDLENFSAPVNERKNRPRTASAALSSLSTAPEIAVTFANQCLVRSYERRTRTLSEESFTSSISYPLHPCIMSSSVAPSSSAPHELSSILSEQSAVPSLEISATSRLVEKLLDDVRQLNSPEQEIKRKLTMVKIQHYRQRCIFSIQSLNKSMVHYNKLNALNDSNHSSELLVPDETAIVEVVSTIEDVEDIAKITIPIDTIFSKINIIFALYTNVLSNLTALA